MSSQVTCIFPYSYCFTTLVAQRPPVAGKFRPSFEQVPPSTVHDSLQDLGETLKDENKRL